MKYFFAICITVLLGVNTVFCQGKAISHKVEKGETITQIAQKYHVTPYDIYQLNPDAQSGLKSNMILIIPNKAGVKIAETKPAEVANTTTHEVLPKETLYGIEKKYGISDENLKKANSFLENDGLQIGQVLTIPSKNAVTTGVKSNGKSAVTSKVVGASKEQYVFHDVLPKETKYSISRKYGLTIEELEKRNPEVVTNLPIGYRLTIKGTAPKVVEEVQVKADVVEAKVAAAKVGTTFQNPVLTTLKSNYTTYEVQPKETLYSLSKMFDISQDKLIELNPELANSVEIGMLLKVPAKEALVAPVKKEYTSLVKIIEDGKRKRMAMLLPFNVAAIQNDTVSSTYNRLKKDRFLNMTLDFYAGALIAIDSAKTLGFPIDVEIYDSEETKNGSKVAALIKANRLDSVNAIVGPFYQSNAEVAAQLVALNNVPVVSPLSKDLGNPYPNLYQTIPTNEVVKNTVFDYMRAHNGNIVAVVDKKKQSILQYLKDYQSTVPLVDFRDNGSVSAESLKSMLVKGKTNYVVMETANTWMIKTIIATMVSAMPTYDMQLVILEPNETLDTDEIKFLNLTKLKLMYPSVIRDNVTEATAIFDKKYKKINNVFPSDYATRGFDVTFDTMLRLVQNVKFEVTVNESATEHVENKFAYYKKEDGGYTNKGVFLMYYDTDLTIKEAK